MITTSTLRLLCAILLIAGLVSLAPTAYAAPITVSTSDDELNTDGDCSLREAIRAANTNTGVDQCPAGSGADTISLPAGSYVLSIAGSNEDAALTGDLDITDNLTIAGAGIASTTLDANNLDRALQILGSSVVQISDLTIQGGDPGAQAAAGISVYAGTLTLIHSRVRNNTNGSGIFITHSSTFTLLNGRVEGNDGSGIDNSGGSVLIMNSTISGNSALTSTGGGIVNGGTMTIVNSTISGNSSNYQGGGIVNSSAGTLNLLSVTITNNTANADGVNFDQGGGISTSTLGGTVSIKNSIIAGNSNIVGAGTPEPDCAGPLTSQGYNLIGDTNGCTITGDTTGNLSGLAPLLDTLQNNGGSTRTHALLAGSPAINAGAPNGCIDNNAVILSTDQRGFVRNGRCDMGAYEYNSLGAATRTPTATNTPIPTATNTLEPTRTSTSTATATTPTATNTQGPAPTGTPTTPNGPIDGATVTPINEAPPIDGATATPIDQTPPPHLQYVSIILH